MNKVTTLNQFIIEQQAGVPQATGGFSCLLHHVGIAAKKVNREVNKAGLVDILGRAGSENVQGEDQQKLDIYANETFLSELKASGECCGVASEENQDIIVFDDGLSRDAKYIFCMDPLDGSSNIDVNVSIGTIFLFTAANLRWAKLRISMTFYSKVVTRLLPVTLFMALLRCWYIRPATE